VDALAMMEFFFDTQLFLHQQSVYRRDATLTFCNISQND